MASHRAKQDFPAYVLKVDKAGLKMKFSEPNPQTKAAPSGTTSVPGTTRIVCNRCTVARFVSMLGNPGQHLVFDETGLTGTYDFLLTFEPEYGKCNHCEVGGGNGAPVPLPNAADTSAEPPPILTIAIRQQLGLRLEQRKEPVDVVIVDRIDRTPVAN
jgi:uncharacterized protein (TIGR03435 family)